ncbi:hypothetical protein M752DRAFT_270355 [Aspergillus phoenicis ATCC 13157]|nr:hypothetical protein M752DRAFT_270355 [Aspergillus phoenicis ATCC 13157]
MFNPLRLLMCLLAFLAEPLLIRIENHLECTGRWKMAQRLREKQSSWRMIDFTETREIVLTIIENDMTRRGMLQKEAFLKDEYRQINKTEPSEGGSSEQLEACHKELDNLDWQIWRTERIDYVHTSKMPESPWRRALLTRRKHPEWYMMKYLRWDCAERGGCCGRDCGCCKQPRSTKRPNALSHCTAECDCCTLFRGFELSAEDQKLANP